MQTALAAPKYNSAALRQHYYAVVLEEVRALPGVQSAAYISFLPMTIRAAGSSRSVCRGSRR